MIWVAIQPNIGAEQAHQPRQWHFDSSGLPKQDKYAPPHHTNCLGMTGDTLQRAPTSQVPILNPQSSPIHAPTVLSELF